MKIGLLVVIFTTLASFCFAKPSESIAKGRYGQLTRDGRLVVFQSKKRLVSQDLDRDWDVYTYNRDTQAFTLISDEEGRGAYGGGAVTSDGKVIAYHAYPASVLKGKAPRIANIVRLDRATGRKTVLTSDLQGESMKPELSKDGNLVAFTSNEPVRRIYVYNHKKESMQVVGQTKGQPPLDRPSLDPQISEEGDWIVFRSAATNLDPPQRVGSLTYHLYLTNRKKGTTIRLDRSSYGLNDQRWMVGKADIDGSGRWIVFDAYDRQAKSAKKMLETAEIFLFDRRKQTITRLTDKQFSRRSKNPSISGNGRFVVFEFLGFKKKKKEGGLVVWDRKENRFQKILDPSCRSARFSYDARVLVYESKGTVFVCPNPFLK